MANLGTNVWGRPNSAAFHMTRALRRSGAPSTLTPSATITATSADVVSAGVMRVPVNSVAGLAVGDIVQIAATAAFVITAISGTTLTVSYYTGTFAPGVTIASGAAVVKQTVS